MGGYNSQDTSCDSCTTQSWYRSEKTHQICPESGSVGCGWCSYARKTTDVWLFCFEVSLIACVGGHDLFLLELAQYLYTKHTLNLLNTINSLLKVCVLIIMSRTKHMMIEWFDLCFTIAVFSILDRLRKRTFITLLSAEKENSIGDLFIHLITILLSKRLCTKRK